MGDAAADDAAQRGSIHAVTNVAKFNRAFPSIINSS